MVLDSQSKAHQMAKFAAKCREDGLPLTAQRRLVAETVLGLGTHPTADEVWEAVAVRMPELSRATVYRTLETLVQMGVITRACHPGRVVRYDPRTELHHHLVCLRCDRIMDLFDEGLNQLTIPDVSGAGFEVSDFRVQIRGVCAHCRQSAEAEKETP